MKKLTTREKLIKAEQSLEYLKGYQHAVNKVVKLRQQIEDEATHANYIGYSDVHPFEIIKRKTAKSILIRGMNAELDESWKPEIVPGGFAGHCTNNYSQKWIITSDEKRDPIIIRKHKDDKWYSKDGMRFSLSDTPCRHYDYNF